jgi:hypothetical protein
MITINTTSSASRPPSSLQHDGGLANILLKCDGQTFEAHKNVVLRSQRDEVRAENTSLRTKARNDHTTISEGAKMLSVSTQQNENTAQQAAEAAGLRAEVNQVRLQNSTLQRSIYDLRFLIPSNAEIKQQLLEYGGLNNFAAQ